MRTEFLVDERALPVNDVVPSSVRACVCRNRVASSNICREMGHAKCLQKQHSPEAKLAASVCSSIVAGVPVASLASCDF